MARLEQSIEVNVPAHTVYNQLTQFEDYPRFMEDVEEVQQLDDTHLHWRAKLNSHATEWDAEILEQVPDQRIVWRNTAGPVQVQQIEVRPLDNQKTKITLAMEYDERQQQGQQFDLETKIVEHAVHDLLHFKRFIETRRQETGEWRGEVHQGQVMSKGEDGAQQAGAQQAGQQAGGQQAAGQPQQAGQQPSGQQAAGQPSGQQAGGQQAQPVSQQAGQQPSGQQAAGQPQQAGQQPSGQQAAEQPQQAGQQPSGQQAAGQPQQAGQQPSGQQAAAQPAISAGQGAEQQAGAGEGLQSAMPQDPAAMAAAIAMNPQTWLPNLLHAWEEPFVMMRKMTEDMDQIFERFIGRPMYGGTPSQTVSAGASWAPPLEVAQRDGQLVIRAEVPGVNQQDVHIEIKNDRLVIEGDRREPPGEAQGFRRTERSYGHFYRVIALPEGVNPEAASAAMRDGVLEITVPMQQTRQQGRQLNIR